MKNQTHWLEFTAKIDPSILERLSGDIFDLGADGLEELNDGIKIYFPGKIWNANIYDALIAKIKAFSGTFDQSQVEIKTIPAENWNESWKENFKLFRLTDRIIIKPDWDTYSAKRNEIVITIRPKMAFGTGHHETTQLVMIMIEKYFKPGMRLLDAGTGSGILSIFALKKGFSEVIAFDNDPVAVENAKENFTLNGIKNKFTLFCGSIDDLEISEYDMIVANIDRNVLLQLPGKLTKYIIPKGILILSGLLSRDEDKILDTYEEFGWRAIEKEQKGAWLALVLKYMG
jgi:ribosomal protein L11 methyltransferase